MATTLLSIVIWFRLYVFIPAKTIVPAMMFQRIDETIGWRSKGNTAEAAWKLAVFATAIAAKKYIYIYIIGSMYAILVTFTINIPQMLTYIYIPYMDPMGMFLGFMHHFATYQHVEFCSRLCGSRRQSYAAWLKDWTLANQHQWMYLGIRAGWRWKSWLSLGWGNVHKGYTPNISQLWLNTLHLWVELPIGSMYGIYAVYANISVYWW